MESVEKQENQSQTLSGSSAVNFPEGNRDSGELKSQPFVSRKTAKFSATLQWIAIDFNGFVNAVIR